MDFNSKKQVDGSPERNSSLRRLSQCYQWRENDPSTLHLRQTSLSAAQRCTVFVHCDDGDLLGSEEGRDEVNINLEDST